jgi:hypothetical protein
MGFDFTLDKYQQLCQAIIDADYQVITIGQFLEEESREARVAMLRHDVDRKPQSALDMARLEAGLGLAATYYFRHTGNVYKPDLIKQIADLGHEVGYHYETLARAGGDLEKAFQSFGSELGEFRGLCDIQTISAHGSPLSKWDNVDLWREYDYTAFGLAGDAVLSMDFQQVAYYSDTGRTWHGQNYKVRDKARGRPLPQIETTDQLIELVSSCAFDRLCVLVHPNRWCDGRADWIKEWLTDAAANQVKQLLILLRNQGPQTGSQVNGHETASQ